MSKRQDDEGVLSRWSRRKRDALAGTTVDEETQDSQTAALDAGSVEPELVEEPLSEDAQLAKFREEEPELAAQIEKLDVDSLKYEDDFTLFMQKKVPEFLRRKALSRLWLSNSILANVDGLNDYDDDFTDAATVIENFQSAYQPGKGYARPDVDGQGDDLAELDDDLPAEEPTVGDEAEAEDQDAEDQEAKAEDQDAADKDGNAQDDEQNPTSLDDTAAGDGADPDDEEQEEKKPT